MGWLTSSFPSQPQTDRRDHPVNRRADHLGWLLTRAPATQTAGTVLGFAPVGIQIPRSTLTSPDPISHLVIGPAECFVSKTSYEARDSSNQV